METSRTARPWKLAAAGLVAGAALTAGCFPVTPPAATSFDLSASAVPGDDSGVFCNDDVCGYTVTLAVENVGNLASAGPLTITFTDELDTFVVPAGPCASALAIGGTCTVSSTAHGDTSAPLDLTVTVTDGQGSATETFALEV